MKKLFIVLAAAFMAVNVNAAKGDMVLSGTVGFATANENAGDYTKFEIAPSFTYFLSDKLGVGAQVGFESNKQGEGDAGSMFSAGVFGRYYFLKTEKFGVFGQADLGFGVANENYAWEQLAEEDGTVPVFEGTQISFGVKPGIQYFINKKFSIEASFGNLLKLTSLTPKDSDAGTEFDLNVNPFELSFAPLQLTLNYHF